MLMTLLTSMLSNNTLDWCGLHSKFRTTKFAKTLSIKTLPSLIMFCVDVRRRCHEFLKKY